MKELNGHTKQAQRLIENAQRFTSTFLGELYSSWSDEKQRAWDWCSEQYHKTENHNYFRVGNANSFGFCASWFGTIDGEPILRYETKDNSYLVWLNR